MTNWMRRFWIKGLIVFVYVSIIAALLYAPSIYDFFVKRKKDIVLYTPRESFRVEKFDEFEKKTGIHVRVTYFNTNEELFAKFKIDKGRGCDVVVPSDYMVEHLVKAGLLQKIDRSKLKSFSHLDPRLLKKYYDPENEYSLPVFWIPYGIGFDKKLFPDFHDDVSWDVIFRPEVLKQYGNFKVTMLNDARESIFLAAVYLFGKVDGLTPEQLEQVKDVLVKQKSIVEAYGESGAKYLLLSGIVPLVVLPSARMKELSDLYKFGFVIPREGSVVDIMNVGIPVTSTKSDMAHELIDFLLSDEVGAYNFNELSCNPANRESYKMIQKEYSDNKAFFPDDEMFKRLFLINNQVSSSLLEKIWFLVKSE